MKVLHIVEATIGGVAHHVQTLVRSDHQRFEVAVACPLRRDFSYGDDRFIDHLRQAGIPVFPVAMHRSIDLATDTQALYQLVRLIRLGRYDIVHTHSSKAGFLGRLAAHIAGGTTTVYTPHGLYFVGLHPGIKRRFYLALEQLAGLLTDCIIAVSSEERHVLLQNRIGTPDRVVCIPNGIEPITLPADYDRIAQRRALGQSPDALLIGTVARLTRQKNPFMFLKAAAKVLHTLPDARFIWCGSGELEDAARTQAEMLGILHACQFLGHRNSDETKRIMAALDIFWLTSQYEGLPYVLLEAMALRVPIVATDVVGTRGLLRGAAGLLVPPQDDSALAQATLMLARRPDRRAALARAGYTQFAQEGTADRMLRAVEEVYEQLLLHHCKLPDTSSIY